MFKFTTSKKIFLFALIYSLILVALALFGIKTFNKDAGLALRRDQTLLIAQIFEQEPYSKAMERFLSVRNGIGIFQGPVWIINSKKEVLESNILRPPPFDLQRLDLPTEIHEIKTVDTNFRENAGLVTKLNSPNDEYLLYVLLPSRTNSNSRTQIISLLFVLFTLSILSILFGVYLYMKSKSKEASFIMQELQTGNLDSRFKIDKIDEIGKLMLDFNTMADTIQSLILRIQTTEQARKKLLQELGHDLRTPLTSLRTAIDTLLEHDSLMSPEQRQQFFKIIDSDTQYFVKMVEDLFFIAEVAEPKYKKTTEKIDFDLLVQSEIETLKMQNTNKPIEIEFRAVPGSHQILGDQVLLRRVIRNAVQNSIRFAKSKVHIAITLNNNLFALTIQDNGPGFSESALQLFGKQRERRILKTDKSLMNLSLGLGSVIINTVVQVHGGHCHIQNTKGEQNKLGGAELVIYLPKNSEQ